MGTHIVVAQVPVTQKGQLIFFQVSIPLDVDCITGMEAGARGLSGLGSTTLSGKYTTGIVKVQAENIAGLCFSSETLMGTGTLEKSLPGFIVTTANLPFFNMLTSINSGKGMHEMQVHNCHTLYGCYEDLLGKQLNRNLSYTISLCVWGVTK